MIDFETAKGAAYRSEQPFGHVPSYRDNDVQLFESGAIVLHIAQRAQKLLPEDAAGQARVLTWIIAALNSVDPFVRALLNIDEFNKDADWALPARPSAAEELEKRLGALSSWLGAKDYLEGEFTAADIIMTVVLRSMSDEALLGRFDNLLPL